MNRSEPTGFLQQMRALKEEEVHHRMARRPTAVLERLAAGCPPRPDFAAAITRPEGGEIRLIAEVKRASPSAGRIREGFDSLSLARGMVRGGAAAISVLTEEKYFQGSLEDLSRLAAGLPVPVMRKDFIIDTYQLLEAAGAGAAACLLIASLVTPAELRQLGREAAGLGLAALFEIHDRRELDTALEAGAKLVGINNRDLATLEVRTETTMELLEFVPDDRIIVSESGHRTRADLDILEAASVDAVLIGEAVMRSPDVEAKVREFSGLLEQGPLS